MKVFDEGNAATDTDRAARRRREDAARLERLAGLALAGLLANPLVAKEAMNPRGMGLCASLALQAATELLAGLDRRVRGQQR